MAVQILCAIFGGLISAEDCQSYSRDFTTGHDLCWRRHHCASPFLPCWRCRLKFEPVEAVAADRFTGLCVQCAAEVEEFGPLLRAKETFRMSIGSARPASCKEVSTLRSLEDAAVLIAELKQLDEPGLRALFPTAEAYERFEGILKRLLEDGLEVSIRFDDPDG